MSQLMKSPFPSPDDESQSCKSSVMGLSSQSFSQELTNDQYHKNRHAVSRSQLVNILRSPAHFRAALSAPKAKETASQQLGTLIHQAILEPRGFLNSVVAWRGGSKTSLAWRKFAFENAEMNIINGDLYDQVIPVRDAVFMHQIPNNMDSTLKDILAFGEAEKTIFWTDEETGIQCRIRVDNLLPSIIWDLKTCADARPEQFLRNQASKLDYDFQAAMYHEGVKAFTGNSLPFIFIAAETEAPNSVWIHETGPGADFFENGMRKFRHALRLLSKCRKENNWPGYSNPHSALDKIPSSQIFLG